MVNNHSQLSFSNIFSDEHVQELTRERLANLKKTWLFDCIAKRWGVEEEDFYKVENLAADRNVLMLENSLLQWIH